MASRVLKPSRICEMSYVDVELCNAHRSGVEPRSFHCYGYTYVISECAYRCCSIDGTRECNGHALAVGDSPSTLSVVPFRVFQSSIKLTSQCRSRSRADSWRNKQPKSRSPGSTSTRPLGTMIRDNDQEQPLIARSHASVDSYLPNLPR